MDLHYTYYRGVVFHLIVHSYYHKPPGTTQRNSNYVGGREECSQIGGGK